MIYGYVRDGLTNGAEEQKKIILASARNFEGEFGGFGVDEAAYGNINIFNRPGGEELFNRLREGDIILATKLDRCFISIENAADTIAELLERNIFFNVLELGIDLSTEYGQVIFDVIETVARFNREARSKATKEAMERIKKGKGPVNKESPMGYKIVRCDGQAHFVPDKKERNQILDVIKWRDEGITWSEILRRMNPKKRANGNKWNQTNIRVAYQAGLDGFPGFEKQKNAWEVLEKDRKHSAQQRKRRGKS